VLDVREREGMYVFWSVCGESREAIPFYKEFKFTLKADQLPFSIAQLVPVSLQFNNFACWADDSLSVDLGPAIFYILGGAGT